MAWEHSGVSANILFYRDEGSDPAEHASVLMSSLRKVDGVWKAVPTEYSVTLYRFGVGEVGRKTWKPSRRLNPQAPSPRSIAKIAREISKEAKAR